MAEVAALKPAGAVAFGIATVRGKIIRRRRHEDRILTAIMMPAKTEFDRPQTIEIRSTRNIGERDDVVTVEVEIGGYDRKQFEVRDRDTGEVSRITPNNVTLDAVE